MSEKFLSGTINPKQTKQKKPRWRQKCTPSRLEHPSFSSWLMVTPFLLDDALDNAHGLRRNNCPMMTQYSPRPSCIYAAEDRIVFSNLDTAHIRTLQNVKKSAIAICDTCNPHRARVLTKTSLNLSSDYTNECLIAFTF